jgi:hypothetical protein
VAKDPAARRGGKHERAQCARFRYWRLAHAEEWFRLLKKSLAPGSQVLERLSLLHFGRKCCAKLGIETGFRLDVATGTPFFNGLGVERRKAISRIPPLSETNRNRHASEHMSGGGP